MNDYQYTEKSNYTIIKTFRCVEHPANNMLYANPHTPADLQMNYWHNIATILAVYSKCFADKFQIQQRSDR